MIRNAQWIVGVALLVLWRWIPHPPNFSPVLAFAMFAGAQLPRKWAVGAVWALMLASDLFLGFHSTMFFVYVALAACTVIGTRYNLLVSSLGASVLFFVVSNFGVWLLSYPLTISGFVQCFALAIPFFWNTLVSTVLFSVLFRIRFPNKIIGGAAKLCGAFLMLSCSSTQAADVECYFNAPVETAYPPYLLVIEDGKVHASSVHNKEYYWGQIAGVTGNQTFRTYSTLWEGMIFQARTILHEKVGQVAFNGKWYPCTEKEPK